MRHSLLVRPLSIALFSLHSTPLALCTRSASNWCVASASATLRSNTRCWRTERNCSLSERSAIAQLGNELVTWRKSFYIENSTYEYCTYSFFVLYCSYSLHSQCSVVYSNLLFSKLLNLFRTYAHAYSNVHIKLTISNRKNTCTRIMFIEY